MLRRHTNKDVTDDSVLEGAKKALYVLVIAAVIMWISPYLFETGGLPSCDDLTKLSPGQICADGTGTSAVPKCVSESYNLISPGSAGVCSTAGGDDLTGRITGATNEAKTVAAAVMDVLKYVLSVGAIATIVIMRVRVAAATTP